MAFSLYSHRESLVRSQTLFPAGLSTGMYFRLAHNDSN
jgi:hypothetical protein